MRQRRRSVIMGSSLPGAGGPAVDRTTRLAGHRTYSGSAAWAARALPLPPTLRFRLAGKRADYSDIRQRRFNMARAAPDLLAEVDRFSFGRNCNRRVT